ncbi:Sulfurtransferase (fragment) [Serratia proteamaculans]
MKELIGGLDFWLRDGHPLATGEQSGSLQGSAIGEDCGCA